MNANFLTPAPYMIIQANTMVLPGVQVLWKGQSVVWIGKLGEPIEDVDCDKIWVSPQDYKHVLSEVANGKVPA